MVQTPFRLTALVGTRPEAIKMAPVIAKLAADDTYQVKVLLSGQHREVCVNALASFGIRPHSILEPSLLDFQLSSQAAGYLTEISHYLVQNPSDLLLAHGDTTTGLVGTLAAFYLRIPVGHVEAGLRSADLDNPFPEEANRRMIDDICHLLFAPTAIARDNLVRENIDPSRIVVTGNTVVDAVIELSQRLPRFADHPRFADIDLGGRRLILVTTHRRENWGEPMRAVCAALRTLVEQRDDVAILLPVHPNPQVEQVVRPILSGHPQIHLTEPLEYDALLIALRDAYLALTDSGGIQEEAPSVRTPVLILREVTERPEAITAGCAKLVGTDYEQILQNTSALLDNDPLYRSMLVDENPFGDGKAAERIVKAIGNWRAVRAAVKDAAQSVRLEKRGAAPHALSLAHALEATLARVTETKERAHVKG